MPRVLLIELSATLRYVEGKLLREHGYEVTAVDDYGAGLRFLNPDHPDADHWAAILVGWPTISHADADELLTVLSGPRFNHVPVLILANEADHAKLDWVNARGRSALLMWDDYRQSPPVLTRLASEERTPDSQAATVEAAQDVVRVLLVDDSPTVRVYYRRLLSRHGYEVETASCVLEGMDKALTSPYDIAIVDYFLPDGTGDELCRQLRDNPDTANITIAIITGTYIEKAIADCLKAGATECMFKNESKELFLARIDAMSRALAVKKAIDKDRRWLNGILASVGEGVYGVNHQGLITFINPAAKRMLRYTPEDNLIGLSAYGQFHNIGQDGDLLPADQCRLSEAYNTGRELHACETVFRNRDGDPVPVECTVFPLHIDGGLEGSVVAFRDITERKLLEQELKWQATHDPLTKLANRLYFEEQLAQELKRLKRSDESSYLLYLDLDGFKQINDTAGHSAGDQLLVEVSTKLRSRLRDADTLARIGGDEFAVILRNVSDRYAFGAADQFRRVLDDWNFQSGGRVFKVRASVGGARIDKETDTSGDALVNADIACFIAKGQGRNHTHIFVKGTDEHAAVDRELGWSSRIEQALRKNRFRLMFQPIAPLATIDLNRLPLQDGQLWQQLAGAPANTPMHYEVLLRMPDSRGELVSPRAFLPTAERFSMTSEIDRWVIASAVEILAGYHARGVNVRFSINLSGQTVQDAGLADYIAETVHSIGVDPAALIFEMTETSAMSHYADAERLIKSLQRLGCQFALYDFGSGFCSFSHLKFLPVEWIKIDGVVVQGVLQDAMDKAIISSIVQIAHSVGKKTVAEYVESAECLKVLKQAGIDFVQGYYISEPLAEVPLEGLLNRCV